MVALNMEMISKGASILAGLFMAIAGFVHFTLGSITLGFIGAYLILFGVVSVIHEFKVLSLVDQWAPFLKHPAGKGNFYILTGFLMMFGSISRSKWRNVGEAPRGPRRRNANRAPTIPLPPKSLASSTSSSASCC